MKGLSLSLSLLLILASDPRLGWGIPWQDKSPPEEGRFSPQQIQSKAQAQQPIQPFKKGNHKQSPQVSRKPSQNQESKSDAKIELPSEPNADPQEFEVEVRDLKFVNSRGERNAVPVVVFDQPHPIGFDFVPAGELGVWLKTGKERQEPTLTLTKGWLLNLLPF